MSSNYQSIQSAGTHYTPGLEAFGVAALQSHEEKICVEVCGMRGLFA
jgi:hypothetical protein